MVLLLFGPIEVHNRRALGWSCLMWGLSKVGMAL